MRIDWQHSKAEGVDHYALSHLVGNARQRNKKVVSVLLGPLSQFIERASAKTTDYCI